MNKQFRLSSVVLAVAASLLIAGCGTTQLRVKRMKPAEINVAAYEQVAVGNMRGRGGEQVSDRIAQALFDSGRFQVLDRDNLSAIMQEQQIVASDFADPSQVSRFSHVLGSAVMVFGSVKRYHYDERTSHAQAQCSVQRDGTTVQVPCTRYTRSGDAAVEVALRIVDTTTGEIIAMRTFREVVSKSASDTGRTPNRTWDPEGLLDRATGQLVARFMRMIAPYEQTISVALYTHKSLPELESGVAFARMGNWDAAIGQFQAAVARADQTPGIKPKVRARAHYDLAIALGYSGSYDDSIREMEVAISISPEQTFIAEQQKITIFKADDERLESQGVFQGARRIVVKALAA